ncbi:hypothetical protein IFM47457_10379 [Aspergillus lentulus]|nr:hypothetical protein IFM47457_10379 [Aspergillus lentulus]
MGIASSEKGRVNTDDDKEMGRHNKKINTNFFDVPDNVSSDETWFRNLGRRKISRTKEKVESREDGRGEKKAGHRLNQEANAESMEAVPSDLWHPKQMTTDEPLLPPETSVVVLGYER